MQKLFFLYFFLLMNLCVSATTDVEDEKLVAEMKKAAVTILKYDIDGQPLSQASGFFINKDGHVITNYHVMKHAYSAKVKTHDGKELPVKLVLAANEITDLVKLSVDTDEKPCGFAQITGVLPKKNQKTTHGDVGTGHLSLRWMMKRAEQAGLEFDWDHYYRDRARDIAKTISQ